MQLCIIYTSDTRSMVCPFDFHHNESGITSLSNFASFVNEQRAIYGDRCMVFDNGNKLSGSPTTYYYNFADTISEPICYRAERLINYNAIGIGAADLEVPECLKPKRHDDRRQPLTLCANLINRQTRHPVHTPYQIFNCHGIRVAVIGMVATTTGDWIQHDLWSQFETQDMIECAKKLIPVVKQQKPDLIVGLFSCNDEYIDPINDCDIDTYKNPSGGLPAAIRVPGFDLVLLGNSKNAVVSSVTNDEGQVIPYIQPGLDCQKAGMVRIHFEKKNDGSYSKRFFTSLIDLKQYEPEPVFAHHFRNAQDSIFLFYNRPIGYLDDDLCGYDGLFGPDDYRDLIHTIQLWYTKADISMASVTQPRDTIHAGPIAMRHLFDIYPFDHQLQKLTMTGEEVRRFLEWGYTCQFETVKRSSDPLLSLVKDPYGHTIYSDDGQPVLLHDPSCFVSAAGIRYTVDITKPAGQRVEILSWSDGSYFDPRGLYRVVVNSDHLRDAGKFISRGLNWDRDELSLHAVATPYNSMRKILFDYVQSVDTLRITDRYDWSIIPERLWREASTREKRELDPIW